VILRKPYAFLIKKFKLIHLIMTILLAYVSFKTANLLNFLNDYIKNGLYGVDLTELINKYIPLSIFITIGLIILLSSIILLLMKIKNKPRIFYLMTIIGYIVVTGLFVVSYFNLKEMLVTIIDPRKIRLTRDFLLITSLGQYVFIAIMFFRATGFNIKKFNFHEDIEELNIDVEDAEEFELSVGVDPNKLKTKFRKRLRILKYIFVENALFIIISLILISLISFGYIFLNAKVINKIYKEQDVVRINGFDIQILNAYRVNKDYSGNIIDNKSSFIILNIKAINKFNDYLMADVQKLKLVINEKKYYPTEEYHKYLLDLEIKPFAYMEVVPNKEEIFSLVYKINSGDSNKLNLDYLTNIEKNKSIKIKLKPINLINDVTLVNNVILGDKLSLKDSILGNSKITINDIDINNKYIYDYKLCLSKECYNMKDYIEASTLSNYDKTLIRLNMNYNIDKTLYKNFNIGDILEYYGSLKYVIKGQEKEQKINLVDRTPKYYKGNYIYMEVVKEIEQASNIDLVLTIRDKQYIYKIK
jgi:hypothetical protein